jgi:hypothetical protein
MVLDSVASPHSKRNYAKALDDLFQFCASRPLSRSLLMEWRAGMESLSPSTINVRLSAVRKMIGEARKNGMIGAEEAAIRDETGASSWRETFAEFLIRKSPFTTNSGIGDYGIRLRDVGRKSFSR